MEASKCCAMRRSQWNRAVQVGSGLLIPVVDVCTGLWGFFQWDLVHEQTTCGDGKQDVLRRSFSHRSHSQPARASADETSMANATTSHVPIICLKPPTRCTTPLCQQRGRVEVGACTSMQSSDDTHPPTQVSIWWLHSVPDSGGIICVWGWAGTDHPAKNASPPSPSPSPSPSLAANETPRSRPRVSTRRVQQRAVLQQLVAARQKGQARSRPPHPPTPSLYFKLVCGALSGTWLCLAKGFGFSSDGFLAWVRIEV